MTKRQRAQVVELLRCAADLATESLCPIWKAAMLLGHADAGPLHSLSITAMQSASVFRGGPDAMPSNNAAADEEYRARCLEAAQRVEEGSCP